MEYNIAYGEVPESVNMTCSLSDYLFQSLSIHRTNATTLLTTLRRLFSFTLSAHPLNYATTLRGETDCTDGLICESLIYGLYQHRIVFQPGH